MKEQKKNAKQSTHDNRNHSFDINKVGIFFLFHSKLDFERIVIEWNKVIMIMMTIKLFTEAKKK